MKSISNLIVRTHYKPHARRAYIRKRLISREKRPPRGYRHGTQLDNMWQAAEQHLITRRHGRALPSIGKLQTTYRKDSSLPPSATTRRVVAGTLVTTQIWTRAGALVFALLLKQVMIRIEGIRAPGVLGFLRPEAQRDFNAEIQQRLRGTVWSTGGCASWYLDDTGRNTTLWPGSTWPFRHRTRRFDPSAYELRAGRSQAAHA